MPPRTINKCLFRPFILQCDRKYGSTLWKCCSVVVECARFQFVAEQHSTFYSFGCWCSEALYCKMPADVGVFNCLKLWFDE